jgi:hypothetical protein
LQSSSWENQPMTRKVPRGRVLCAAGDAGLLQNKEPLDEGSNPSSAIS